MSNGIEMTIENLKRELNDIQLKLSECRKNGLDTKIAELKVMNIPHKIKLVEVTQSYKDIEKINNMLEDVKNEMISIEKSNPSNVINVDGLKRINILISKINKALNENKLQEARSYYLESVRLYKKLKYEDKKKVFERLDKLREMLSKLP
jgi:hypothetical protein